MASSKQSERAVTSNKGDFTLVSEYKPCGDQPKAIKQLVEQIESSNRYNLLHGVTGTGKTFVLANVIQSVGRPCLVLAPNKTLAAQLYSEFKEFFPKNRVRYFVSFYDYYQPEAYIPSTNTYIEKDSSINDEIDKMRHSATRALLESRDTIVVSSVSCIYGLGAPEDYFNLMLFVEVGERVTRSEVIEKLVALQYTRQELEFKRGTFRTRGDTVDIFPSDQDGSAVRIVFFGNEIEELFLIDPLTGRRLNNLRSAAIYPVSHFLTGREALLGAVKTIEQELEQQLKFLHKSGKLLEAERLEQRTRYDLELLREIGFCPGIENYSRHLAGKQPGATPSTLIDYFSRDFLLVVDESHVTVSQLGGMYHGDRSRKKVLVEHGFRLPSALDNRPLNGEEFWSKVGQVVFVSATPGDTELKLCSKDKVVSLINRPTGILDPEVEIRPAKNQIDDLIGEINHTINAGDRVLVTTLTKRSAERLSEYLKELNIKARYLHSDITTVERVDILRGLRKGDFDVLIGINLLREGLDLVEVALVAILDADKEGFLRSSRSLIQTMGRAARNVRGRVIMYADKMTASMKIAIDESNRRRTIQSEFNQEHGIVPRSTKRSLEESLVLDVTEKSTHQDPLVQSVAHNPKQAGKILADLRKQMFNLAAKREYEEAAVIRDQIQAIEKLLLELDLGKGLFATKTSTSNE